MTPAVPLANTLYPRPTSCCDTGQPLSPAPCQHLVPFPTLAAPCRTPLAPRQYPRGAGGLLAPQARRLLLCGKCTQTVLMCTPAKMASKESKQLAREDKSERHHKTFPIEVAKQPRRARAASGGAPMSQVVVQSRQMDFRPPHPPWGPPEVSQANNWVVNRPKRACVGQTNGVKPSMCGRTCSCALMVQMGKGM